MADTKFKKVVYFENKKVIIRDFKTTMILNLIPMVLGISVSLIPIIGKIFNQPQIFVSSMQISIIIVLFIFGLKHIANLQLISKYTDAYNKMEEKIEHQRDLNASMEDDILGVLNDSINNSMVKIEQKIKRLRTTEKLKSIMYIKILFDVNCYELLELLQQKFYVFGYGEDDIKFELDVFNSTKLKEDDYFNIILNMFINMDLKSEDSKEYLKSACNDYLILFNTNIN